MIGGLLLAIIFVKLSEGIKENENEFLLLASFFLKWII